jgi:hypothetical protein
MVREVEPARCGAERRRTVIQRLAARRSRVILIVAGTDKKIAK